MYAAPGTMKGVLSVKQHLIDQIIELLHQCEDLALLDLILKLLLESSN